MAKHKTTLRDIARELNITPSTVSRALHHHPGISEATRLAVEATAKRLNYQPNQIAAALRSGRSFILGVLVPSADRSFFPSVIRGIEEEVNTYGYSVIVGQTYEDPQREQRVVDSLLRTRVDGVVLSIAKQTQSYEHLERIQAAGIPLVLFDNTVSERSISTVRTDDFQGAYRATEHLIQQGKRRILHLVGPRAGEIYRERLRGYRQAMQDHRLALQDKWIIDCPSDVQAGRERMERVLQQGIQFDAVFSSSDYAALGAQQYLLSREIKIPTQIAIVGFGNAPFTALVSPSLSTVDQNGQQMGKYAARIFLEQIQQQEAYVVRQHILPTELMIRASSSLSGQNKTNV